MNNSESASRLSALRRKIAGIEHRRSSDAAARVPVGYARIDERLGGGLECGRLHEIFTHEEADATSAASFAAMLSRQVGGTILWLREERATRIGGNIYAPGLSEIGIDPASIIMGVLPDATALLRAAAEGLRCRALSVTVIELWRMPRTLDLTASRKLALAAEDSGVTALLLRIEADPEPNAAQTRWSVRSIPSLPIEAGAPGAPALEIELLRQRGGAPGGPWQVEWDRDARAFHDAPFSGAALPLSVGGPVAQGAAPIRRTG